MTGLVALMLTSCITNKPIEVAEATPPSETVAAPAEMPKTTNDVQPNVTAADEATWAEIEERQRQQELIRQALEEAARLEAERIEKERLEAKDSKPSVLKPKGWQRNSAWNRNAWKPKGSRLNVLKRKDWRRNSALPNKRHLRHRKRKIRWHIYWTKQ